MIAQRQAAEGSTRGDWTLSCDFDGTITCTDMVQAMLDAFADPQWREIEAEWVAGGIGSKECLERQTHLLRVSPEALGAWVDVQPIDPGVVDLFTECARLGLPAQVISDGYDWVIRRVMQRVGLTEVPIVANRLIPLEDGRWRVEFPHARRACSSGACKCAAIASSGLRAHIGDGRSDVCVSGVCELVFAKGSLLRSREFDGVISVPFETLSEICTALPRLAEDRAPPRVGASKRVCA